MLNNRIEIDSTKSPYKVQRKRPAFLDSYFPDKNDWFIFCERIDGLLVQFEEIKAAWMVLGVACTILLLGLVVGIVVSFVVVEEKDLLGILAGCLFAGLFVVFAVYFFLMDRWVLRPLDTFAKTVDDYCAGISEKNGDKVHFRLERSRMCALFWDSDFKVWIDVSTSDAVDLAK
ncbi:hypothetical protein IV203_031890 [Nitzschia inconspicua]|uniref:Uncharacterized protein n=1 Tax=Nitzschia inconspicua TaxID=303405 RepID=A0A9K3Q2S7_9STRA|nr:hypothetical protein IV203_031890 [Nitzschia inconspicua]